MILGVYIYVHKVEWLGIIYGAIGWDRRIRWNHDKMG